MAEKAILNRTSINITYFVKGKVLISVIMPVYNEEEHVRQAIDSILQQTFAHIELIVINDASTDRSEMQIRSFADERLVCVNNPLHAGNYKCRNQGARLAQGKYIAVMDADDIACPDRLEKQFHYLEKHPDVLAVGSDRIIMPGRVYNSYPHTYEEILFALLKDNAFVHSSMTMRANVFRHLGGYDEHFLYAADYDLACRLALSGQIVNLSEALVYYRLHQQQISQKHRKEQTACAAKIRQRYQQQFINRFRCDEQAAVGYPEVSASKIGRAIACYTYACYSGLEIHRQLAEEVFDEAISTVSAGMPLRLEQGLLGVATGLVYLLRNGFVKGDEDEVLAEIDNAFIVRLSSLTNKIGTPWYDLLYYVHLRLSHCSSASRRLSVLKLSQTAIYLLECIARSVQNGCCLSEREQTEIAWLHKQKLCPVTTFFLLSGRKTVCPVPFSSFCTKTARVAFLIPLRIDSQERKRNLDVVLAELIRMEEADIYILEADSFPRYRLSEHFPRIHYQFIADNNPVFHRTRYLNILLQKVDHDIVGIWDADVVVPQKQIRSAVHAIVAAQAVMAFPYDGRFCSLPSDVSEVCRGSFSFNVMKKLLQQMPLGQGFYSVGGAFFVHRQTYLRAGGENERFYGWGPEDVERVKRMEILGWPIYRVSGVLFHLYHPRNENSRYASKDLEKQNICELLRVCAMTRSELLHELELAIVQEREQEK